jgi:hypothetical protein
MFVVSRQELPEAAPAFFPCLTSLSALFAPAPDDLAASQNSLGAAHAAWLS